MADDIIEGEVLSDGTFRLTTGKISGANHTTAENLLRAFSKLTDGKMIRHLFKRHSHGHTHQGQRDHAHE